jgi:hypothetical protein
VQTKTKDLPGFSFRRVQWERDGKKGERSFVHRLVKFEIFVEALLHQIVHMAFPTPPVNSNVLEIIPALRVSTIKTVHLLTA